MKVKKKWMQIISFLLVTVLLMGTMGMSVSANEEEDEFTEGMVGSFNYMAVDGEATLMFCDWDASGIVEIPSHADGYPVTAINSLAFSGCEQITGFSVEKDSLYFKAIDGVLYDFNATRLIAYPQAKAAGQYVVPQGTIEIGDYAFLNCANVTGISLPDSLMTICFQAFIRSGLQSVEIPANMSEIEGNVFGACTELGMITVAPNNASYMSEAGVLFNADQTQLIAYPAAAKATAYTIPASVQIVGDCAFLDAANLSDVSLPDGMLEIGEEAFSGCVLLKEITIPTSVNQLGAYAFSDCQALEFVVISETVKTIPFDAFSGCVSLTEVFLPNGIEAIEDGAFRDCTNLEGIRIPTTVTVIEETAFDGCDQISIACFTDSYAHTYAIDMGIPYFLIDDITPFGDLDGDSVVTPADARIALRIAAQIVVPTHQQLQVGDLDKDGVISTSEARTILRIAAHLESFDVA